MNKIKNKLDNGFEENNPLKISCREIIEKEHNIEMEILRDQNLLLKIIEEIQKEGVVGEENTILAILNKISLRLVKSASPTSSNLLISDESGGGKDFIVSNICKVVLPEKSYFHKTDISEKALNYWNTNDEDFTWDGKVIYLEDPGENLLQCQAFKVMASGGNSITVLRKQNVIELETRGKPVIIVTSLKASLDEEGGRRWDALRIDTSEELTKAIKKRALQKASGSLSVNPNHHLRNTIQRNLKPYEVVIPYAEILCEYIPEKLIIRTQTSKLLDYIRASAIIHQYQREKDDKGRLIANCFDYDYARFVFSHLHDAEGRALNIDEEEFLTILRTSEIPLGVSEILTKFHRRGKDWIYEHIDSMKARGLIQQLWKWDERANRDVMKLEAIPHDSNHELPSCSFLLDKYEAVFSEKRDGNLVFGDFVELCKRLDRQRVMKGLKAVFQDCVYKRNAEMQITLEENI